MPTSPVDSEAPVDVGQQTAAPSPADSAPAQPESSGQQPEQSEAEQQAKFLETALQAADAANPEAPPVAKPQVAPEPKPDSALDPKAKADPAAKPATAPTEPEEEDEGEDKGEPFGKHPRWQKMVAARNEYRSQAQSLSADVEALRAPAHEYRQIESYMATNGLTPDEVIDGFKVMALMKHDPAAAREALIGHLNRIDEFLGNILPDDLQRQVDEGFTTEEIAREAARSRKQQQRLQNENQQYRQYVEHQGAEQQQAQVRQSMVNAVSQWEAQIRTRDPDYAAKEPFVVEKLQWLRTQYRVETPEQAIQLAQMAYDQTTKALRGLTKKPEVRPTGLENRAVGSATTKAEPRSFQEACLQAAGFTE
jgi:hypothetical protein